jgi:hypothetical protein
MNLQQQPRDSRLRKAIERWENEGGRISVKSKEEPERPQGPAKRKVTARRSTSAQTKSCA